MVKEVEVWRGYLKNLCNKKCCLFVCAYLLLLSRITWYLPTKMNIKKHTLCVFSCLWYLYYEVFELCFWFFYVRIKIKIQ
jgi:hypothetical protein